MSAVETREFTAQTRELLKLMVHSLYSNREIFLRELISNASDALDKLRFESYSDPALMGEPGELAVRIEIDAEAGCLTVSDNGIGMTRDEVVENLGTIAHSGTAAFAERLAQDAEAARDSALIGQFGVGFYASFMVADEVTVLTRKAGEAADAGICWRSDGTGRYTLEPATRPARGTAVTLKLREDCKEFLEPYRIEHLVRTYSDHITFPVQMPQPPVESEDGDDGAAAEAGLRTLNKATALWTKPKADISDAEYAEFFTQLSYDPTPPLAVLHNRVEGQHEYTTLLFIPGSEPFDLWDRERRHGVRLYVRRVFILDDAEHLLPAYLRFVRGVIDSDDLPLNVSREILQSNRVVDSIRAGNVRRVLGRLEEMAREQPEDYARFWGLFGRVLKEGVVEDHVNQARIAGLLRFSSTREDAQAVSLDEYVARMADGQQNIYYLTADSLATAKNSPQLELFRARGVEVLLLHDVIDEWVVSALPEYEGKSLKSAAAHDLELEEVGGEVQQVADEEPEQSVRDLVQGLQQALSERVERVRVSDRLTHSAACLVAGSSGLSTHMDRILKASGQGGGNALPVLEINPRHALIRHLNALDDRADLAEWAHLLYEQSLLSEGGQLDDPSAFVGRMDRLLVGPLLAAD